MSYDILYNQFGLEVEPGQYLLFTEVGSNNVFDVSNLKKRSRSWGHYRTNTTIYSNEETIKQKIDSWIQRPITNWETNELVSLNEIKAKFGYYTSTKIYGRTDTSYTSVLNFYLKSTKQHSVKLEDYFKDGNTLRFSVLNVLDSENFHTEFKSFTVNDIDTFKRCVLIYEGLVDNNIITTYYLHGNEYYFVNTIKNLKLTNKRKLNNQIIDKGYVVETKFGYFRRFTKNKMIYTIYLDYAKKIKKLGMAKKILNKVKERYNQQATIIGFSRVDNKFNYNEVVL